MTPKLSAADRAILDECIYYLNLEEMREFCRAHDLPLMIHVERPDGRLRASRDRDRKDVVLARILEFALNGKRTGPTVYSRGVVSDAPLPERLTRAFRLHYGQYDKKNERLIGTLKELTGGTYRNGMIARFVLRDFWTSGSAPTLQEFAEEWLRAQAAHTEPRPEGAYLVDLAQGRAGEGWKQVRNEKAKKALAILARLVA